MLVEPQQLDTGPALRELKVRVEAVVPWLFKDPKEWREMSLPGPQQGKSFLDFCLQCPSNFRVEEQFMWGVNTATDSAMASLPWSGCHMVSSMAHSDHRHRFCTTCQETLKLPWGQRQQLFQLVIRMTHTKSKSTLQMGQSIAPFSPSHPGRGGKANL